ncbi:MAG: tetratricopeptide repeat protein [Treponema sp.]|nr:tetratricopeptide repeat protein [Treponema sp.]
MKKKLIFLLLICFYIFLSITSCNSMAVSAEEYYLIGMAYFDLGRYEEAQIWLNRARQADKTMAASTYNLGRLAFEMKQYDEAVSYFEEILIKDPDNILALKAAAYTRIRTGDFLAADNHYKNLLRLIPESADDGYNHALVLYAMERYGEVEITLERYPFSLLENRDIMLLYARSQKAQNKIEAIDSYASLLVLFSNPAARYEYAQTLEYHEIYARAVEEYRQSHFEASAADVNPDKSEIRFAISRALLIADSESRDGITELENAVEEGFKNIELIENLLNINNISLENSNSLRVIINNLRNPENPQS